MNTPQPLQEIEVVADRERAQVLLRPPRLDLLELAREPVSATELGAELGLARQKVNYHVKALAEAGFLRVAAEERKRNLIERKYVATARAYVLAPEVLGPVAADHGRIQDAASSAALVALAARVQSDVGRASGEARRQGKRLATLSIATEIRFTSAEQREAFARALAEAITKVVGEFAAPAVRVDGTPADGRPYRLVVGCYPAPPEEETTP